jgi:predicted CXXCH cytochrome family protein
VRQSPHAKPFEQLGLGECTACHDKHDVFATSWLAGVSPDSACSRCHAKDAKVRLTAERIAGILRDVRTRADAARKAHDDARRAGLLVRGAGPALDELTTQELKLATLVHTVDKNQLETVARAANEAADRASQLAEQARFERRVQRRGYYAALGLSLLLLCLLLLKIFELERRRRRSAA